MSKENPNSKVSHDFIKEKPQKDHILNSLLIALSRLCHSLLRAAAMHSSQEATCKTFMAPILSLNKLSSYFNFIFRRVR